MSICPGEIPAGFGPTTFMAHPPSSKPAQKQSHTAAKRRVKFSGVQGRRIRSGVAPTKPIAPAESRKNAQPTPPRKVADPSALASREPAKKQTKSPSNSRTTASVFHGFDDSTLAICLEPGCDCTAEFGVSAKWGGRRDLNPRQPDPQSGALTRLSYGHHNRRTT